jgi:hypothetical protein
MRAWRERKKRESYEITLSEASSFVTLTDYYWNNRSTSGWANSAGRLARTEK